MSAIVQTLHNNEDILSGDELEKALKVYRGLAEELEIEYRSLKVAFDNSAMQSLFDRVVFELAEMSLRFPENFIGWGKLDVWAQRARQHNCDPLGICSL